MRFKEVVEEEPKDRTKWMWLGVIGLFIIAVVFLWTVSRTGPDVSRVRAKHILIKFDAADPGDRARALARVNDLRDRIMKGKSFERLAKDFSNDEFSSPRGGDLGYHMRGAYEKAFEEHVWSAPLNQLSEVVQSSYGFHLITVVDRHISSADQYEMELEKKAADAAKAAAPPAPAAPAPETAAP